MLFVLSRTAAAGSGVHIRALTEAGESAGEPVSVPLASLPAWVARREAPGVRWVWSDTRTWYPRLLRAEVRVRRAYDLRLGDRILRGATRPGPSSPWLPTDAAWSAADVSHEPSTHHATALFGSDLLDAAPEGGEGPTSFDAVAALQAQFAAAAAAPNAAGLRFLIAVESAGALAAAEMRYAGLPWRADVHAGLLETTLGARPPAGARPARLEALAVEIRGILEEPLLNPDSPPDLLRALRRAGLVVESTSKWQLRSVEHPVVAPLLEYKRLSRLFTANGWAWLDTWVHQGRFHPEYVVGGVVSGRWAASGGGALQLPKQVRTAVVADAGWKLVVADAAQLEPRVLAALAHDTRMAAAGRGRDLYDGIVATGAVPDRPQAKTAMLGAMYGATQGRGGQLVPRLARAFPQAIAYVERAARAGERGERVTSLLGRTSPAPDDAWLAAQTAAFAADAAPGADRAARARARSWGRFTRNFVVQATAAEWALAWMAGVRTRLADAFPRALVEGPHLVYFLHDELIVHAPTDAADWVADAITEAAAEAGRILFGTFPITFPLSVAIVDDYGAAK